VGYTICASHNSSRIDLYQRLVNGAL